MNVRQCLWRQASRIINAQPQRTRRQCFASKTETIEAAFNDVVNEKREIEEVINSASPGPPVPTVDAEPNHDEMNARIVADYKTFQRQTELNGRMGSHVAPHYKPHTLFTHPPSAKDVTLELLLASQSHMGHSTSLWHPANARYIFGIREGIHIISLDVTAAHLRRAAKIVSAVTEGAGLVLFVGTRKGQRRSVVRAAELAGGYHVFDRWISGAITNAQQVLGSKSRMKVVDEFDRQMPGYDSQMLDRAVLRPDLVICLNPRENYVLLHECGLAGVPTIGVVDTNTDPSWVTYPIPANDDSPRCVQVIAGVLGRAGQEGQRRRRQAAEMGIIKYPPALNLSDPSIPSTSDEVKPSQ